MYSEISVGNLCLVCLSLLFKGGEKDASPSVLSVPVSNNGVSKWRLFYFEF